MTLAEFKTLLESAGMSVAYQAFPEKEQPVMPFIVYQETGSDNFGADNKVWSSARRIQVDLLSGKIRDYAKETALETVLDNVCLFWERVVDWDEDETCYRITYEVEI